MNHLPANLAALESATGRKVGLPANDGLARIEMVEGVAVLTLADAAGGPRVAVNSRRDPVAEARRTLDAVLDRESAPPSTVVCLGLGLGYVLDAIEHRCPGAKIVALEPEPSCIPALLGHRDLAGWLAGGRLLLLWGPDYYGADGAWRFLDGSGKTPPVVVHHALARRDVPGFQNARAVVERMVFGAYANAEARRKFAGRYLLNTLRNLPAIARSGDAGELFGMAVGRPGIVISAGPSLDANVEALREVEDRAVLISTDTALRPLLLAGIHPPLAVAVDPSESNARHLTNLPPTSVTCLVAEGSIDPHAIAGFGTRLFTFKVSDHHPWPWLRQNGLDRATLRAWGSVATTAFDLAVKMGCDPIIFAGQDLAFTGNRPYCRGTIYEEGWGERVGRGKSLEELWHHAISEGCTEPDLNGRPVRTTPSLVAFRDWLVEQAGLLEPGRVINATGAGIFAGRNVRQASIEQALGCEAARLALDLRPGDRPGPAPIVLQFTRLEDASLVAEWHQWACGVAEQEAIRAALDAARRAPSARADVDAGDEPAAAHWTMLPPERAGRVRALLTGCAAAAPQAMGSRELMDESRQILESILERDSLLQAAARTESPATAPFVPASYRFTWSPPVAREVLAFEERIAAAVRIAGPAPRDAGFDAWLAQDVEAADVVDRPVPASGPAAPAEASDETAARFALADEWLAFQAAATGEGQAALARARVRLAATARNLAMEPATGDPRECRLDLGVPSGLARRVRAWRLMRQATGLLALEQAGADDDGRPHADPRSPVLGAAVQAVEPVVLTQRGLPRCHIARPFGEGAAVVTATHTPTSFRVDETGAFAVAHEWPLPITGEIAFGDRGGALAWSNPGRQVLLRASADSPVVVEDLPFRPLRVALTADGDPVWCAFGGGIWRWLPGRGGSCLVETPAPIAIHTSPEGVRLDPAFREADGYPRRVLATSGWLWRFGSTEWIDIDLGRSGQCTSTARAHGWSAAAHPYADIIRLADDDGTAIALGCYYPLTVAWAGDSLLATTGDGDVLFFANLATVVSDLSRQAKEPGR